MKTIKIDTAGNPELEAMLKTANRPDLVRSGLVLDAVVYVQYRNEQDRLHPAASDRWKDAHAAYSAYFGSKPTPTAQIELDPAQTPAEAETKVFRALNAFLADSAVTREAVTGGLRAAAAAASEDASANRDALSALTETTAAVTNKAIDRITGSLASNTDATIATAEVIAASARLAADQISDSQRQTACAVREVRNSQGDTNAHLGIIGKAIADLTVQSAKDSSAQRSLLLDAKNEAAEAWKAAALRDVEVRGVIQSSLAAIFVSARRNEMAGYGRLILLIGILLILALRGNAQTNNTLLVQPQNNGSNLGGPVAAGVIKLNCPSASRSGNTWTCNASGATLASFYTLQGGNYYYPLFQASGLPDAATWTWLYQPTGATVGSAGGHAITLYAPGAASDSLAVRQDMTALGSSSFTLRSAVMGIQMRGVNPGNHMGSGICVTDGTKVITLGVHSFFGTVSVGYQHWSNATTVSGQPARVQVVPNGLLWLQASLASSTLTFAYSFDGTNFVSLGTESVSSFLAAGSLYGCISADSNATTDPSAVTLVDWSH